MKKCIVTTTIYPPSEAVRRFDRLEDWHLIVVGDKKTPADFRLERGTYVSPQMQQDYDAELSEAIGWNSIQRRSFGLLWAHEMGAEVVALVDDDNIPYDGWDSVLAVGREIEVSYYETDLPAFDPVGATNHSQLWHRGYPLQLLPRRDYGRRSTRRMTFDVQACFWNGDPDIDAVCRMIHAPDCRFDPACFPMAANRMAPFNSQNTFMDARWLRDYFLFPHVGRMDDIWAAYYLQARGARVVFDRPTVVQERNNHDLTEDMRREYLGYENNLRLVKDLATDPERLFNYLPERSAEAFRLYRRHFVQSTPAVAGCGMASAPSVAAM